MFVVIVIAIIVDMFVGDVQLSFSRAQVQTTCANCTYHHIVSNQLTLEMGGFNHAFIDDVPIETYICRGFSSQLGLLLS